MILCWGRPGNFSNVTTSEFLIGLKGWPQRQDSCRFEGRAILATAAKTEENTCVREKGFLSKDSQESFLLNGFFFYYSKD